MQKNIIFDFDGTIVESRNLIVELYNEVAERDNYKKIQSSEIYLLSTVSIPERCKGLGVPMYKLPPMLLEVKRKYRERMHSLSIKDGVVDVISKLKDGGYRLGIISSNAASSIEEFLKARGISAFENIYSAKNLFGKHYTINGYVKKYNLDKKDVFYIGDEIRDVNACKKCGVKIFAVTWGYDSEQLLKEGKPEWLIKEPHEIISILGS